MLLPTFKGEEDSGPRRWEGGHACAEERESQEGERHGQGPRPAHGGAAAATEIGRACWETQLESVLGRRRRV